MTNEEKAIEILSGFDPLGTLVEMAEWKDQQFKEYLKKRRNKIAEINTKDYKGWEMYYMADITEIINELFGED